MRIENRGARWRQTGQRNAPLAEINIIPLVDVMLVLLIIFMVTTAFTKDSGLKLDLPTAKSSQAGAQTLDDLVIALGRGDQITLDGEPSSETQIAAAMRASAAKPAHARRHQGRRARGL